MPDKVPATKELRKIGKGQKTAPSSSAPITVVDAEKAAEKGGKVKKLKPHAMPPVVRRTHVCRPHPFQDRMYGDQMRLMNACVSKMKSVAHRCTVCSHETDG